MKKLDLTANLCHEHVFLLSAKYLLVEEIKSYPAPIAGCDAQFNHVLEKRSKVTAALAALDKIKIADTSKSRLNRRVG